jgi:hypothetical protein
MMATFGAQAELTAMDDSALESVTGQAGITIEQSITSIDVTYVDQDGDGVLADESGALKIGGIAILQADLTTAASLTMDIDVVSDTPATTNTAAIKIQQSIGATDVLKIGSISVGGDAVANSNANTALLLTAAGAATSIGEVYVSGLDMTMYVYGH